MDKEVAMVLLEANPQPILEAQCEQSTRLTAVRFLLEDLFAGPYCDRLPQFTARMAPHQSKAIWRARSN